MMDERIVGRVVDGEGSVGSVSFVVDYERISCCGGAVCRSHLEEKSRLCL